MIEVNKIYHMDNREGLPLLPDKCANLIISDPPYFEVKGKFDFVWKSFDEYLEFMEDQAQLYKRILADNGTLFVWGHAKKIAYVQVIFDKYFDLCNVIKWRKTDCQTRKGYDLYNIFPPVTEHLLMYSQDEYNLTSCVFNIRDYIREEIIKAKGSIVFKDVNSALGTATNGGGVASACLSLDKSEPAMFTKEMYQKLRSWLGVSFMQKEYEELRKEYEELRRPFDNVLRLDDVWDFAQDVHITGNYDHETKKPEKVTRALILTCSRKNDLVVVPFSGSGTECAMSAKEGRKFIGFDTKTEYADMGNERVHLIKMQPNLFHVS